jgi:pimeloyl-ACP methyl ester carboxylesterase
MTQRAHHTTGSAPATLHVERWGEGERVVLVHGSLAFGEEEWAAQRPLADAGFELVVFDRRGYGRNAGPAGEDFLVDADDVAALLGDGAHIVGHSYGGLGAMLAAAQRPEATLSLTLLEAPAGGLPDEPAAWTTFMRDVRTIWNADLPDREWVVAFLSAVGSDPDEFPAEFLDAAVELVPVFRNGRAFFEADLPYEQLAAATFPKLVVAGGHHPGFDAMCDHLATTIGGTLAVVEGAGHEIQFTGDPINERFAQVWGRTGR